MYEFLSFIGGGIAASVVWFFKQRKLYQEVRKLKADTEKSSFESLEKSQALLINIHKALDEYRNAHQKCQALADAFAQLYADDADKGALIESRRLVCRQLGNETFHGYRKLAELTHGFYSKDKFNLLRFVNDEVVGELGKFARWLNILNREELLNGLGVSPARIDKIDLAPFYRLTRGSGAASDAKLKMACARIIDAGAGLID